VGLITTAIMFEMFTFKRDALVLRVSIEQHPKVQPKNESQANVKRM